MKRESVESSNLASVGYDADNQILEIEFHHGGVYQYFDVPFSVYEGIKEAASKGQYLAQHIKGYYRYVNV